MDFRRRFPIKELIIFKISVQTLSRESRIYSVSALEIGKSQSPLIGSFLQMYAYVIRACG